MTQTPNAAEPAGAAGPMKPEDLFSLVAEEVLLDGVVDSQENKLLNHLARYLGLESEAAMGIAKGLQESLKANPPAQQRALSPRMLYAKTLKAVFADGIVDEAEAKMLRALRRLFRLSDRTHHRMVDLLKAGGDVLAAAEREATPRTSFEDLLSRHVAASVDKQQALLTLIGPEHSVALDLEKGRIEFDGQSYSIQLLGSVAKGSRTWSWSWAEEGELPNPALVTAARQIRDVGIEEDIYPLSEPVVALEGMKAIHLALVATGLVNAQAFYRAESEKGDLYVLIVDPTFPRPTQDAAARILQIFPGIAAQFPVNHEVAFRQYLAYHGLDPAERLAIVGRSPAGSLVSAVFDQSGRFLRMG